MNKRQTFTNLNRIPDIRSLAAIDRIAIARKNMMRGKISSFLKRVKTVVIDWNSEPFRNLPSWIQLKGTMAAIPRNRQIGTFRDQVLNSLCEMEGCRHIHPPTNLLRS